MNVLYVVQQEQGTKKMRHEWAILIDMIRNWTTRSLTPTYVGVLRGEFFFFAVLGFCK